MMEKTEERLNVSVSDPGNVRREKIRYISIHLIDDAPQHPFYVRDDEEMAALMESISLYGVLTPCILRRRAEDRYEMISGHRRKYAVSKIGLEILPAIIRDCDDDQAIIAMVDSNLQRERIRPSEKAFAYKLKVEALRRQGKRTDLTSTPMVSKLRTTEQVGKEFGDSREQVRRYIRLTYLIPELLEDVDLQMIALRPAVELSYLTHEEQKDLSYIIDTEELTPSLAQAIRLHTLSQEGKLDFQIMSDILSVKKPNQIERIKIPVQKFDKYFSRGTTQTEMETVIFAALDEYFRRRARKANK